MALVSAQVWALRSSLSSLLLLLEISPNPNPSIFFGSRSGFCIHRYGVAAGMDGSEEDSGLDRSLNSRGGADKISCVRHGSSSSFLNGRRRSAWEISLREWLDRPGRPVDMLQCLHVFQQVVDVVGVAHSQSVVLANARPSCFVVSSFNRVAFVESVSCSSSGSESCGRRPGSVLDAQVEDGRKEVGGGGWPRNAVSEMNDFPMKRMLVIELDWYTSPEEVDGCAGSLASDVYRLGVLLFEVK